MALFGIKLLAAVTIAHAYVWWRSVHACAWPRWMRVALTGALACGLILFVAGFTERRLGQRFALEGAAWAWAGALFFIFGLRLLWDAVEASVWLMRRVAFSPGTAKAAAHHDDSSIRSLSRATASTNVELRVSRRVLLARTGAISAGIGGGVIAASAVFKATSEITTPEVIVRLPRLPKVLDGFRLALLTDLHIGPFLREEFTARVVDVTNRLQPDAIAICGDLIDLAPAQIARDLAPLGRVRSRFGTYFVTGNHEYYWNAAACMDAVRRLGVRVLTNERVELGDPGRGAGFDLAGIPDETGRLWQSSIRPNPALIAEGRDDERELILLAHQPLQIPDAVSLGAGLQLSGHTHGGQIWPFGAWIQRHQPYIAGLHQHTKQTQIYVSRGTGFWGPPVRVLAPAEVTSIILVGE